MKKLQMAKRSRAITEKSSSLKAAGIAAAFLLLTLVLSSCGDDGTKPGGGDSSDLSMVGECVGGVPKLKITNSADAMEEPRMFRVLYEDAAVDSGDFLLGEHESATFGLSNMHGIAYVTIDGTTLSVTIDNCLQALLQPVLDTLYLDELIPSPVMETDLLFCHYSVDIENLQHDPTFVEMLAITGGMHVIVRYSNITADIIMDTENPLCADATGTMTISSIVLEADFLFDVHPDQSVEVTLANMYTTVNDLYIQIDGALGFLVNWIIDYFVNDFIQLFEEEFTLIFQNVIAPMLEDILVPI